MCGDVAWSIHEHNSLMFWKKRSMYYQGVNLFLHSFLHPGNTFVLFGPHFDHTLAIHAPHPLRRIVLTIIQK